jgi:hypothetical protein
VGAVGTQPGCAADVDSAGLEKLGKMLAQEILKLQ